MANPTGDWSVDLAQKIMDLVKNPANFSAQQGIQALLRHAQVRMDTLEAKVARLEQGKAP